MRCILLYCGLLCALLRPPGTAATDAVQPPQGLDLVSAVRVKQPLEFCGEPVPLEQMVVRERLEKELLLILWDRPQVILWLKRLPRYMSYIEKMLSERQLPDDLKYIALVESALRPHAGSSKGAIGFWQFMRATGRRYGLRIDEHIDERRNFFASTRAALLYLQHLRAMLGSWTAAAAGYNMGEEGLKAEMLAQEVSNFYELYLPLETQRYLFRIIAAKLIVSAPANYGFHLTSQDVYPPLAYDRVTVDLSHDIPLQLTAKATGTTFSTIKNLNPQIRGHFLVRGRHTLLVPPGAAEGFNDRLLALAREWTREQHQRIYVVQKGDSLSMIAERFRVPLPALLIWNRLKKQHHIHPGDRLVIYAQTPRAEDGNASALD